jgi:uncharacterized protein YndB with AHSA1/START domain
MARIVFEVAIDAEPKKVLDALNTPAGIAGWWTEETEFTGASFTVSFPNMTPLPFELRVDGATESRVHWTSVGQFPPHWVDTEITWTITAADGGTLVHFSHDGWAGDGGQFPSSALVWGQLMLSLKSLVETGTGDPLYRR